MDWLRRAHRNINDCVANFLAPSHGAAAAAAPEKQAMVVSPPGSTTLDLHCDKLTPEECGHAGGLVSRGAASRVRVDCLLYDDEGMRRLTSKVPMSKIEMDFTELFSVPDLVSDSDDD